MIALGVRCLVSGSISPLPCLGWRIRLSDEVSLVRTLNRLVRTPLADLDRVVTETLADLSAQIGATCVCLLRILDGRLTVTHQCPPQANNDACADPDKLLSTYQRQLLAGKPVLATAGGDGLAMGFLALPIQAPEGLGGILGFCFDRPDPSIPTETLDRLGTFAEMIDTVLDRQRREAAHRDTAQRLAATLSAMPDLLFELTADGTFAEFGCWLHF